MLNREFADLVKPHHDYTSCSDESPINGFGTQVFSSSSMKVDEQGVKWHTEPIERAHYRCPRCAILEILVEDYPLEKAQIDYIGSSSCNDAVTAAIRFKNSYTHR